MPTAGAKRYAVELAMSALALGLASQLLVSCLSLGDTENPSTGGGGGSGGTDVGDASWTGGSSSGGSSTGGGPAGGSAGAGGGVFVPGSCAMCTTLNGCECVPEVGQGWTHIRKTENAVSKCQDSSVSPVIVGTGATDTGCGGCTCGSATPGSCGIGLVSYSYAGCAGTGYYSVNTTVGTCFNLSGASTSYSPKAFGAGGGCGPGTAPPKPPAFATPTRLCAQSTSGTCGTNGSCVAKASSNFDATACVMFDSQGVDVACPAGYPNKLPFATGFDDTRTCKCTCKASVSCSGGSVSFDCVGGANDINSCRDGSTVTQWIIDTLPTVQDTSCYPDGAATPSGGTLAPSGLRVVCCR